MMSYAPPCVLGDVYLYSFPHGSLGSVAFFQYGPFQLVAPDGAVISACRPSDVVG
jgi:hypothetical protein